MQLPEPKKFVLLIIVFSLVVRIGFSLSMGLSKPLISDAYQYDRIAYNLAIGKGYILKNSEPNVTRAPMFPIFLAGVYKVFGYQIETARISVCILGGLIVLFIYLLGKASFSVTHGLLSAAIASFYPPLVYISYQVLSENLFTLFLIIGVYFLILAYKKENKYMLTFCSGLVLGLSALTRPISIIIPVFFLPWFCWAFRFKRGMKLLSIFIIPFVVVQLPWVIRNYVVYNTVIIGTAKGGIDLWWSNNPKVLSNENTRGRQYRYFPINGNEHSIVEKNREAYRLAFTFVRKNISKMPKLILYKHRNFWNMMAGENIYFNLISLLSYGVILPFYVFTILRISFNPDEKIIFSLLTLFFIFVTSLYYGTVRFRMPLEPFILILGVEGFFHLKDRIIALRVR